MSTEDKKIYLMGDFNIDLTKVDDDLQTSTFFDNITSNLFVPHIILPTRITPTSKTLIDNIYSNLENFKEGISGNLTLSISDHLAQFLIIPIQTNQIPKIHNLYKRDVRNFDRENFILDFLNIDWDNTIQIEKKDPNVSFNSLLKEVNTLVDQYLPLKKITKKEIRHQFKPWITNGIRTSIKRREKLYKKFLRAKDENIKEMHHKNYKTIRNQIVTLCRESKKL